jgi:hypothetical protein
MSRDFGASDAERLRRAAGLWVDANTIKRGPPKSPAAQARYVRDNLYGGSTRRMAGHYGVTQRTIERWIKGDRGKKSPLRDRLSADVREVRRSRASRRARLAMQKGVRPPKVKTKAWIGPGSGAARFGAPSGTDTRRLRTMPERDLDPDQMGALIDGYESGDDDALREVVADVYGEYFDSGPADVGGIDWIEFR